MARQHKKNKEVIKKAIAAALRKLKGKKSSTKIDALKDLSSFGEHAAHTAEFILPFVEDEDDSVIAVALQALVDIGYESPDTRHLVRMTLLKSENHYVRCRGYWILERIEPYMETPGK